MGIARFFNLLLGGMAVLVCVVLGNSILGTSKYYSEVQFLGRLAESRTAWSSGTVSLSLERSVVQVALALDGRVPSNFRQIIDAQRSVSNANLDETVAQVTAEFQGLSGSQSFLSDVREIRAEISDLRREVDTLLQRPSADRNPARVAAIPLEMKARISELQALSQRLRFPSTAISDAVSYTHLTLPTLLRA